MKQVTGKNHTIAAAGEDPGLRGAFLLQSRPLSALVPAADYRLNDYLTFDEEGLGASVINQIGGARRCHAFMKPETFLSLASSGVVHDSKDYIVRMLETYKGTDKFRLAPPYLMVQFNTEAPPLVVGHEGRNRMRAISALGITDDIPVVIHGFSAQRDLPVDAGQLQNFLNGATGQSANFVAGPLFSRAVIGATEYLPQPSI